MVQPSQLDSSLAVRRYPNLFLAGQINGTSGYEEAAGQGLIAGLNAARLAGNMGAPLVLKRDQAFLGVMIDDLCTKEIVEPYRLFTSRAEYRLSLRQDNADRRLTRIGYEAGLATREALERVERFEAELTAARRELAKIRLGNRSALEMLSHPDFDYRSEPNLPVYPERLLEALITDERYAGYIAQQRQQARKMEQLEEWLLPADFNYDLPGISVEARQKLTKRQPANLGQASRIDGVTPAEIAILQVHAQRLRKEKNL
jgi:tRNA uridine 5-carboxymethylaminomethyl modification enzyme